MQETPNVEMRSYLARTDYQMNHSQNAVTVTLPTIIFQIAYGTLRSMLKNIVKTYFFRRSMKFNKSKVGKM